MLYIAMTLQYSKDLTNDAISPDVMILDNDHIHIMTCLYIKLLFQFHRSLYDIGIFIASSLVIWWWCASIDMYIP